MALLSTRARTHSGAGTIATLLLVLAFGNQAYVEWAAKHAQGQNAGALFLRTLAWPQWSVSSHLTSRQIIGQDLRALLLIVFVAALLGLTFRSVSDWIAGFLIGWMAVILAGALAALLTSFIANGTSFYQALGAALSAAGYGLIVGWIVGLLVGRAGHTAVTGTD
jgi:uncharacterized membrane protein